MKYLALLISLLVMTSCSHADNMSISEESATEFDFSYQFSLFGRDKISSFDHTFQVDTIDGPLSIDLYLSENDKSQILDFIMENNMLSFTSPIESLSVSPEEQCRLFVRIDNSEFTLLWKNSSFIKYTYDDSYKVYLDAETINQLTICNDFNELITNIIYNHPETQDLPQHQAYK